MPKPLFNPHGYLAEEDHAHAHFGERGAGKVYLWDRTSVFAVQVAKTPKRPLLLRGPAGSGKSSLAPFVANTLRCRFYGHTVAARTQARDLMWEFDALQRLNDANVAKADPAAAARVKNLHNYITPGALWWGFDPKSAAARGALSKDSLDPLVGESQDPATLDPNRRKGRFTRFGTRRTNGGGPSKPSARTSTPSNTSRSAAAPSNTQPTWRRNFHATPGCTFSAIPPAASSASSSAGANGSMPKFPSTRRNSPCSITILAIIARSIA